MTESHPDPLRPDRLRCATVLRVTEQECQAWTGEQTVSARFAPMFPAPRTQRVSPGHLVALAIAPDGAEVVVWRWYDAVVLGEASSQSVRLWEPAHGEVVAQARESYRAQPPGSRAYASAGLPGADWWVSGLVVAHPPGADVELPEVDRLFTDNGLWASVFTY